jgi:hypothetical protein
MVRNNLDDKAKAGRVLDFPGQNRPEKANRVSTVWEIHNTS